MAGTRLGAQDGVGISGGEEMSLLKVGPYTSVWWGLPPLASAGVMAALSFRLGTSVSGSGVMGQSNTRGLSFGAWLKPSVVSYNIRAKTFVYL